MREAIDMSGRVVVVTGGGKGIGRGIASRFLEAGADVVVCGRKPPESLPRAGEKNELRWRVEWDAPTVASVP